MGEPLDADLAFCRESLVAVSRTFARPIALLPPRLEVAVTVGYLLCRVVDTIEDHPGLDLSTRDALFTGFLDVIERGHGAEELAAAFSALDGDGPDLALCRALPRVLRVYASQEPPVRTASARWIAEMARGMQLHAHREPGPDGFLAPHTLPDLERYCYYVAGTVGHLLTDLFVLEMGVDGPLALAMRDRAEGFATGLQLTNVLKDVTDDHARGVCYVPRTECARHGLVPEALVDPLARPRAHAAVAPVFSLARARLDEALDYALLVPAEHPGVRLFCLVPLWLAARTLVLARGNDAVFTPGAPVKITRAEVEGAIAGCVEQVSDDAALREGYRALYDGW